MIQKSNKNNNLINILVYSLFKSFSLFINFFPRKFTILFGKFLGLIMFFTFSKNRKIAKKNLNIAFPNLSNSKINQLLKRVFQHYGIISIDFFRQKTINIKSVVLRLDNDTQKALSNKKGIVNMWVPDENKTGGFSIYDTKDKELNKYDIKKTFKTESESDLGDNLIKLKEEKIAIKIDVERHEKKVLDGIRNVLNNNKTIIQVELFDDKKNDIFEFLNKLNYTNFHKIKKDYYFKNF